MTVDGEHCMCGEQRTNKDVQVTYPSSNELLVDAGADFHFSWVRMMECGNTYLVKAAFAF